MFLKIIGTKWFPWVLLGAIVLVGFALASWQKRSYDSKFDEYKRQLEGKLSDKERELQSANDKLGLAKAKLVSYEELISQLESDNFALAKEFEEFKKKHKLIIESKDEIIAKLEQQINGGNSSTTVSCGDLPDTCEIAYAWSDLLGRFKLSDPNIFEPDNETFQSSQIFKVYGEIYRQEDGYLKVRRAVVKEVYRDEDGNIRDIDGGTAEIIDSEFVYTNDPSNYVDETWLQKHFKLRPIILSSFGLFPNPGDTRFGAGIEFFNFENFGLNTHTALDFNNISEAEQRLGLVYNPKIFDININLAVGASVGTKIAAPFSNYSLSLDLLFYLY